MSKLDIKFDRLTPFKRCVLQNFPFIEEDFDALTNYQLLSKVVEYLNEVIGSQNKVLGVTDKIVTEFNDLYDSFFELYNYVHDFFDNLDVQEEVNQKLDEMAESGELSEAIQLALSYANYQKSIFGERIINGQATKVACVGDSLTWCQKPGDTSTQLTTWSSMLETFVNSWRGIDGLLTCYNYGVKGQVSSYANDHFSEYLENSPNVIFWAYGTNDMTHNVTVDQFLANLKTFYGHCIDNNIELIVIISPPSFQTYARRNKMLNLARAERAFCKKYGIRYVDMFEYVENLYTSQAYAHNVLQSDNTHFSDYTCYRDAIISELLTITFNQDSKTIDYIDVGESRDYFHCNGNAITVAGGINMFNRGWRMRQEVATETYFSINLQLNKKSKVYLLTYGNSTAGKCDYSIDGGTSVTINTQLEGSSASTVNKEYCEYIQIGGVMNAGMHQIVFNNFDYSETTGNGRIYVFGFIIEEINDIMIDSTRLSQLKEQLQLWSGNETSLSDVNLHQNVNKFNRILVEFGNTSTQGISYAEIYPHNPHLNFDSDGQNTNIPYNVAIPTISGIVQGTITIDHVNNTLSFASDGTVYIRRIIGFLDNNTKNYNSQTQFEIADGATLQ